MRKFAFLSIIMGLFVINAAFADGTCNWEYGDFSSDANEYLYKTSGQKQRLECDNGKCGHEKLVLMPANHYFDGDLITKSALYMCIVEGDGDLWKEFGPEDFDRCPGYNYDYTKCENNVGYKDSTTGSDMTYATNSGENVLEYSRGKLCYFCQNEIPASNNGGGNADGACTEGATQQNVACSQSQKDRFASTCLKQCIGGKWKTAIATCKAGYTCIQYPDGIGCKECKKKTGGGTSGKTCREQRSTINGKACCDTLSLGKYNSATDQCVCVGDLEFKIENGTGYCKSKANPNPNPGQNPGAEYNCNTTLMANIDKWLVSCATNADIVALISQIKDYCAGPNRSESTFMAYYNTLLGYNPQSCGAPVQDNNDTTDTEAELRKARSKITKSASALKNMSEGFKVSVWKNKEGNFNTARLASDSIAGVVLGTAGGLITSNVVKKNQVKNGFEDIQCTIGGQVVADWGDEFRVGIQ